MPTYKSYCRSLGTTSFRRNELNKEIESQLELLNEFWGLPENIGKSWVGNRGTQTDYYNFMLSKGFVAGDAPNKDKDAREKTSGLVDLGLATEDRRVTQIGNALLEIVDNKKFVSDNILGIAEDGFVYLKQLIKTSFKVNQDFVRPFLVIVNALCEYETLSYDEFWLLPLILNSSRKEFIFTSINNMRKGLIQIDDIIWQIISSMDNYQEAQSMLLHDTVSEDLITEIGMNRDGARHDKPYYKLYKALLTIRTTNTNENALSLYDAIDSISEGCKPYWKKLLFNEPRLTRKKIQQSGSGYVNLNSHLFIGDDSEFKKAFFKCLHLIKAKNLLDNYADLNKRILKTTNAIIFQDNTVKLDIIPRCFFTLISSQLQDLMFVQSDNLHENIPLESISEIFNIKQEEIVANARKLYGIEANNLYGVQSFADKRRYERLNQLIDKIFTDEVLVDLMTKFENRSDSDIQSIVTNNADIPTIFEYVLAIVWYKISGRQGKVLDYMNLSLDADLLPITHAAGGHEDITYKYEATVDYPKHTLLIEATLANSTNQRRMEMEPVSRHLGDYLLSHSEEAYCLFATTFLHVNVVADFRSRKNTYYYSSSDESKYVDSMKIIPCNTAELKTIIQRGITYAQLYKIFETAYQTNTTPNLWYQQEIVNKL